MPELPVVVSMVPEVYWAQWKSNKAGVLKRPSAIVFNEESSLIFVADSKLDKLKIVDMHIPANVVDVVLRVPSGLKFQNCRSMAFLGEFLVFLVDVLPGQSGLCAINAKLIIRKSARADATCEDGVPQESNQRMNRGEKVKCKVAQLLSMATIPVSQTTPQLHNPFSIAVHSEARCLYISDCGADTFVEKRRRMRQPLSVIHGSSEARKLCRGDRCTAAAIGE